MAHYWSFDGECGALVRVEPDPNYVERLLEAETEFWRRVVETAGRRKPTRSST